jgi:hypothetical protein
MSGYSDDIILSHCFTEKCGNAEGCLCAYCVFVTPVENYSDKEDMVLHTKGSAPQKVTVSNITSHHTRLTLKQDSQCTYM